jgi:hypothetical protein
VGLRVRRIGLFMEIGVPIRAAEVAKELTTAVAS